MNEGSPQALDDDPTVYNALSPNDPDEAEAPIYSHEDDHEVDPPPAEMQLQRVITGSFPTPQNCELGIPLFAEITQPYNRRALLNHFSSELSTLMTFSGEAGNPFRELVMPLCENSQPLLYAVLALSSAHLEFKGVRNKEASIDLHSKALHSLSQAIARQERGHALVTAIIMLIYYETLVHRGKSNIVHGHLKAALSMIKPLSEDDSAINKFLSLALYFHDVIAALSTGTAAQSSAQSLQTITLDLSRQPSSLPIDALLGLTTELWPIIHDISHVMKMRKELGSIEALGFEEAATALRAESSRKSDNIRLRLDQWKAIRRQGLDGPKDAADDPALLTDLRIQSIASNAEAYHHAAFVYFYRNIETLPRRSPVVQYHAKEALVSCLRVVMFDGPMAALLWPLFIGACEVTAELDRNIARTVFQATMNKQGFVNIAESWDVVQAVWKEGDEAHREVSWEEIGQAQSLNLIFA